MTSQDISEKVQETPDELESDDMVILLTRAGDAESPEQNESLRLLNQLFADHLYVIARMVGTNNEINIEHIQNVLDNLRAESRLTQELTGEIAPELFQILLEDDSNAAINQFQKSINENNPYGAQLVLRSLNKNRLWRDNFKSCDFTAFPYFINEENDALMTETCKFINELTTSYGEQIFDSQIQDEIVYAGINRLEKTVSNELLEVLDELDWPEDALSQFASITLQLINHDDDHVRVQAIEWAEKIAMDTPHGKGEPKEFTKIAEEYDRYVYNENGEFRADVFKVYALVVRSEEFLSNTPYGELTTHRRVLIEGLSSDSTRQTAASTIYEVSRIDQDIFVKELPVLVESLLCADSDRVRSNVAAAIWMISDENPDVVSSAIPSLIQSLNDPSRRTVESVLAAIDFNLIDKYIDEFKPAVPRLIPLLDDSRGLHEVRGYANGVFGTIADERPEWVLPYVQDLLSLADDHPPVLTHVETLSTKQPETIRSYEEEIQTFLDHERPTAREYACSIAGKIILLKVVDELGEISREDPEPDVRKAADDAIDMIAEEASEQIGRRARDPNTNALEFSVSTQSQEPITHEVPFFIEQISDKLLLALNNGDLLDLHIYSVELADFIRGNPIESPEHSELVSRTEAIIKGIKMERKNDTETVSVEIDEKIREVVNRTKKMYLKG